MRTDIARAGSNTCYDCYHRRESQAWLERGRAGVLGGEGVRGEEGRRGELVEGWEEGVGGCGGQGAFFGLDGELGRC